MSKLIDLTGQVFGDWTVIGRAERARSGKARWVCSCACGAIKIVMQDGLTRQRSRSCKKCARRKTEVRLSTGGGPVKEARHALGMTQAEFAVHIGVSVKGIQKVEREQRAFSLNTSGVKATLLFNKAVPSKFRQKRNSYRVSGRQQHAVVIKNCGYCKKIVEQFRGNARRISQAFCNRSCSNLFRQRGPKPIESTPELSPDIAARFEPYVRDKSKIKLDVALKKSIKAAEKKKAQNHD